MFRNAMKRENYEFDYNYCWNNWTTNRWPYFIICLLGSNGRVVLACIIVYIEIAMEEECVKMEELAYQFLEESEVGLDRSLSLRQLDHKLSQMSIDIFKQEESEDDEGEVERAM